METQEEEEAMSEHQHRFRPFGTFNSSYPIRFVKFKCRCGRNVYWQGMAGIPEQDWRWAYLTEAGLRREQRIRLPFKVPS